MLFVHDCLIQVCLEIALWCLSIWALTCACVYVYFGPLFWSLWLLFWAYLELPKSCLSPPFHWLALPHVCLYACKSVVPCHVASLACMSRLHCILHACLVPWLDDRNWALFGLIGLHCIWNQSCILGSLGHHAWKCVIGGPRIEAHAPLSHYHDKGHGWCIYALNCAAMLCLALCCCHLQILQEYSADR